MTVDGVCSGDPSGIGMVRKLLSEIMLRRTKGTKDVNGEQIVLLPPKTQVRTLHFTVLCYIMLVVVWYGVVLCCVVLCCVMLCCVVCCVVLSCVVLCCVVWCGVLCAVMWCCVV